MSRPVPPRACRRDHLRQRLEVKVSAAALLQLACWCCQRAADSNAVTDPTSKEAPHVTPAPPAPAEETVVRQRRWSFPWINSGRGFRRRGVRNCWSN